MAEVGRVVAALGMAVGELEQLHAALGRVIAATDRAAAPPP